MTDPASETPGRDRLTRQLAFILEIDRLKCVIRRTLLTDRSRRENSAEHSWHLAVMALVLAEHAPEPVDVLRVVKMLLIHDIVEVDAGDVFLYDEAARAGKEERERAAAHRIFGLLPDGQGDELVDLWEEFEARETPEARFAYALDRLQPLMHNYATEGASWQEYGIRAGQVRDANRCIGLGAEALWEHASRLIEDAIERGWLVDEELVGAATGDGTGDG